VEPNHGSPRDRKESPSKNARSRSTERWMRVFAREMLFAVDRVRISNFVSLSRRGLPCLYVYGQRQISKCCQCPTCTVAFIPANQKAAELLFSILVACNYCFPSCTTCQNRMSAATCSTLAIVVGNCVAKGFKHAVCLWLRAISGSGSLGLIKLPAILHGPFAE
jgi:hypothetical protein